MRKSRSYIGLITFLTIILSIICYSYYNSKLLESNIGFTKAMVKKCVHQFKGSDIVYYTYYVCGREYNGNVEVSFLTNNSESLEYNCKRLKKIQFLIEFSRQDFSVHKILNEHIIINDDCNSPKCGWTDIPFDCTY